MLLVTTLFSCVLQMAAAEPAPASEEPAVASSFTKHYGRDDLRLSLPPNPNPDLGDLARSGTIFTLNHIAKGFEDPQRRQRLNEVTSLRAPKEGYGIHRDGRSATAQAPDIGGLRSFVGLDVQRLVKREAKNIPQYVALVKAAKMDLKLDEMFKHPAEAPAGSDPVRYGLAVISITPDLTAPAMASLGDSSDELRYAGHAHVEWGIEPTSEAPRRLVLSGTAVPTEPPQAKPLWKMPSPNFSTSATAEGGSGDDISKVDARALPTMRFDFTQEDGYYSLAYRTSGQGKKIGLEHTFKVPVGGTAMVGRRFNDKLHLLETSAYDILFSDKLPSLNLHHMHLERRLCADLSTRLGASHVVGISARGETQSDAVALVDRPRSYAFNYGHSF